MLKKNGTNNFTKTAHFVSIGSFHPIININPSTHLSLMTHFTPKAILFQWFVSPALTQRSNLPLRPGSTCPRSCLFEIPSTIYSMVLNSRKGFRLQDFGLNGGGGNCKNLGVNDSKLFWRRPFRWFCRFFKNNIHKMSGSVISRPFRTDVFLHTERLENLKFSSLPVTDFGNYFLLQYLLIITLRM